MIWKKNLSLAQLDELCANTAISYLGIKFSQKGNDFLEATMQVDEQCCQPMGFLHGGISVTLAETVGSLAGYCCVEPHFAVVGAEINASHLRTVKKGDTVVAKTIPLRLGKQQQVWQIEIKDSQQKLCCIARLTLAVIHSKAN